MIELNDNDRQKEELNYKEAKKELDDYIILKNSINSNKGIKYIMLDSKLKAITEKMKELIIPTEIYMQNIDQVSKSMQNTFGKIKDIIRLMIETIAEHQIKMTPYFKELGKALNKAKENPDSLINWINYCNKLEDYFWTFPFDMKTEELKKILENANSEEEFDKYMVKYFNKKKIEKLSDEILLMIPSKHKVMFRQIINAFYNKNYALGNLGITAIIDDLCTFFLNDKSCTKRQNLLLPIIEEVDVNSNIFEAIPLIILNSNINTIYEDIKFNKRITIGTHKKARRNPNQHGKCFANNKLDTIMLLNTMYYMLIVISIFSKYKGKIIYVRNNKEMKKAKVGKRKEKKGFYIRKKYYRAKND